MAYHNPRHPEKWPHRIVEGRSPHCLQVIESRTRIFWRPAVAPPGCVTAGHHLRAPRKTITDTSRPAPVLAKLPSEVTNWSTTLGSKPAGPRAATDVPQEAMSRGSTLPFLPLFPSRVPYLSPTPLLPLPSCILSPLRRGPHLVLYHPLSLAAAFALHADVGMGCLPCSAAR